MKRIPAAHRLATKRDRQERAYERKVRRFYRLARPAGPPPIATTFEQFQVHLRIHRESR